MSNQVQNRMKRVPIAEQNPEIRAKNFEEVFLGYSDEEAIREAIKDYRAKQK